MAATCRSCGRPVIWATVEGSGKKMPVDPVETTPHGNVILYMRGTHDPNHQSEVIAKMHKAGAPLAPGEKLRVSHFTTCPAADLHRAEREERSRRKRRPQ